MTRCMIRKSFFHEDSYVVSSKDPDEDMNEIDNNKVLIEFCLPFVELKHIVDGMVDEDNLLELEYPVGDSKL